jgi:predicted O-methyltransferase YrrM
MEVLRPNTTEFAIGSTSFVVDITSGKNRRKSDERAFTIVKSVGYLNQYISLSNIFKPKSILELGVFQGGGFAFLDALFEPSRMSAIEIDQTSIPPLHEWVLSHPGRSVHFGKSQADTELLKDVVQHDLGGVLDLVVDDASHLYEESKHSFETLFPLLSPGGYYVIEDWTWSYGDAYQGELAPNAEKAGLSNLVFDIIELQGSTDIVSEVRTSRQLALIKKSATATSVPQDFWQLIKRRGKKRDLT